MQDINQQLYENKSFIPANIPMPKSNLVFIFIIDNETKSFFMQV